MSYRLYKAHFKHPMHEEDLIVYYDKDQSTFCFATKDIEEQSPEICKFQYPADSLHDVKLFIEKLGVDAQTLTFRHYLLH
ncbi:hypothetical protein CHL76_14790 [Marinococcus halophilus]|uniref:Uncharacterized protein n=2 Tax=Marinococcus TaxID=1370 RepID=A0A1H2X8J8_9BACI|nr:MULTISPECIES: hypothetical protein [Marinococcus]MDZ5783162.1 hypothetical protein [Marinococcus luteus]OZT79011.1 hypothetical protein CHL76_14790 [Marinococcus halophilus]GEK60005.1 hypothetical protein MHA01_29100 [Marinococcus halophilus]SDW89088.1 hypothetical protein SAMN05421781_2707 [Marinococcus luteus]